MRPAMENLAGLGYHAVEVSQIPMTPENIRELQYADQNLGIRTVSMSCGLEDLSPDYKNPGDTLANDFNKIVEDCQAVGCGILRIGLISDPTHMSLDIFGPPEEYAEVGEGCLDMPAIIQAGLESGSEYFLIEQDNQYDRNVYDSLRISRDNLIKLGYADWF